MNKDFTSAMAERTDEELVRIVTVQRNDYQAEAVLAAEAELATRQISPETFEVTKEAVAQKTAQDSSLELGVVSSWIRLIHFFLDGIAFLLSLLLLSLILELILPSRMWHQAGSLSWLFVLVVFFAYYAGMEYKFQKTPAKFATNTKVVMITGERPTLQTILIRTVLRFIPLDRLSFLFTKQGFHDSLSHTMVVKDDPIEE